MTSEDPQHPGQEPEEAAPDATGPAAAYGSHGSRGSERFPAQDGGVSASGGTGWAPPPPVGRATPAAWSGPNTTPDPGPRSPGSGHPEVPVSGNAPQFPSDWGGANAAAAPADTTRWDEAQGSFRGTETPADISARVAAVAPEPWSPDEAWGPANVRQTSSPQPWAPPPQESPPVAPTSPAAAPGSPVAPTGYDGSSGYEAPGYEAPPGYDVPPGYEAGDSRGAWDAERPSATRGADWTDSPRDTPIYQPAPSPGISPDGVVPLPPQETRRVPGASLAAAPPADYQTPAPHGSSADLRSPADPPDSEIYRDQGGYRDQDDHPEEPAYQQPAYGQRPDDAGYPSRDQRAFPGINGQTPVPSTTTPDRGGASSWGPAGYAPPPTGSEPAPPSYGPPGNESAGPSPMTASGSPAAAMVPRQRPASEPAGAARVGTPHSETAPPPTGDPSAQPAETDRPAAGRAVSASAAVPLASRVMPPTDHAIRPMSMPPPQPRVYGRPAGAQADPGQRDASGDQDQPGQRPDVGPRVEAEQTPSARGEIPRRVPGIYGSVPGQQTPGDPPARSSEAAARVAPPPVPPGIPGTAPDQTRSFPGSGPIFPGSGPAPFGDLVGSPGGRPTGAPADSPFGPGLDRFAAPGRAGGPAGLSDPAPPGMAPPGMASPGMASPGIADRTGVLGGPPSPAQSGPGVPAGPNQPYGVPPQFGAGQRPDEGQRPGALAGPGGWGAPSAEPEQSRFAAFKPETAEESKAEPPTPQIRNGRVLAAVLTAAVLILAIPLGSLWLLGKTGGSEPAFNPAIGECVRNQGDRPVTADCADQDAFKVISKVAEPASCADPTQPHIEVPAANSNPRQVLCLQRVTTG